MKNQIKHFNQFILESESESFDVQDFNKELKSYELKFKSRIEAANKTMESRVSSCWDPKKYERLNQIKIIYGLTTTALASYALAAVTAETPAGFWFFATGTSAALGAATAFGLYARSVKEGGPGDPQGRKTVYFKRSLQAEMEEFTSCLIKNNPLWATYEGFTKYWEDLLDF